MKPYPQGSELIEKGKCPKGNVSPMSCMFCMEGHMTECHYPHSCADAECNHYLLEIQVEGDHQDDGDGNEDL